MSSQSAAIRTLAAIAAASAISLSTPHFLPAHHPINQIWNAVADEDDFEDEIEDDIEEEIDEDLDDEIEDEIEDDIEEEIDEDLDDEIEDEIEDDIEEEIDEDLDDEIQDEIEDDFEDEIDDAFEDEIEDEFEDAIELEFEEEFEDDFDDDELDEDVDDEIDEEIEEDDEEFDDDDDEDEDLEEDEDELEEEEDDDDDDEEAEIAADLFEMEFDEDGDAFASNEFLILGSSDEIDAIIGAGLITESVSDLESLDLQLVRVSALGSQRFEDLEALVSEVAPDAEIDVNHLYLEQADPSRSASTDLDPDLAAGEPLSRDDTLTIGLIDTKLNRQVRALERSRIVARDFVNYDANRPQAHGTAIASILVGESGRFSGWLPNAQLFAASVFFETPTGGSSATTDSLVSALDWLVASDVQVINMSLSGPPNTVLERAITRVQSEGISIVAAVGNDGPAAPPRYPAAYEGVIGVTAVSSKKTVFRRAGRGDHIDFSAVGVDVPHVISTGELSRSTGTSFAAPFVSANFAIAANTLSPDHLLEAFVVTAEDLGPDGYDPIYGHGLLRPLHHYQTAGANPAKNEAPN